MQSPIRYVLLGVLGFFLLALFGYTSFVSSSKAKEESDTYMVLATTGMIADIARNVGGEMVAVEQLMGPGIDPHTYKPTASDIEKMRNADLILSNGLHLEAQIQGALDGLSEKVVLVSEDIDRDKLLPWKVEDESVPASEAYDPHIWNDVSLWIDATHKVSYTLQERDTKHASVYEANADIYIATLLELDVYVRTQIASIPEDQRYLVSTHDAFSYFSRAYDMPTRALLGISTEAEASTRDVQELADFIAYNQIPAVFGENITSDKFAQSVVEAVEERGHKIQLGGQLYSDALGEEGSPQDTYEGMIRSNVDTIVTALGSEL